MALPKRKQIRTNLPVYKHDALPSGAPVRLLTSLRHEERTNRTIHAEDDSTAGPLLRFSLKTADLDDSPEYDCLSYTWGNPHRVFVDQESQDKVSEWYSHQEAVICNGNVMWIGRNLCSFLHRLLLTREKPDVFAGAAGRHQSSALWIDAISIDQTNLEERGQQVRMMDRIYREAGTVIAWLGEEDTFMRPALNALISLCNLDPNAAAYAMAVNPVQENLAASRLLGIESEFPTFHIYAFLNRAWFRRAWIVQEAILARRLVVFAGSIMIPYSLLVKAADRLQRSTWWLTIAQDSKSRIELGVGARFQVLYGPHVEHLRAPDALWPCELDQNDYFDPTYAIKEVVDLRARFGGHDQWLSRIPGHDYKLPDYHEILTRFRAWDASDPRDKVYAFLGLTSFPSTPDALMPDYSLNSNYQDVYISATRFLLITDNNLNILSHKETVTPERCISLPSWVPDLHVTNSIAKVTIGDAVLSPWFAAGEIAPQLRNIQRFGRQLMLKGLFVDSVAYTGDFNSNLMDVVQLLWSLRPYYHTDSAPSMFSTVNRSSRRASESQTSESSRAWQADETMDTSLSETTRPEVNNDAPQPVTYRQDFDSQGHDQRSCLGSETSQTSTISSGRETLESIDKLSTTSSAQWSARRYSDPGLASMTGIVAVSPYGVVIRDMIQTSGASNEGDRSGCESTAPWIEMESIVPSSLSDAAKTTSEAEAHFSTPAHLQTRIEVFWRTLLADCCDGQHPAPLKYGFAFTASLRSELNTLRLITHLPSRTRREGLENMLLKLENSLYAVELLAKDEPGDFVDLIDLDHMRDEVHKALLVRYGYAWAGSPSSTYEPIRFLPNVQEHVRDFNINHIEPISADLREFWRRRSQTALGRRLFTTRQRRYLGYGPVTARAGDEVWVLAGGKVPYVLRPRDNGNYEFIG